MSIHPASTELLFADFIPHAEFVVSVEEIKSKLELVEDCDDLDDFTGGAFAVDGQVFTIKHYKGGGKNTFTVYMPRTVKADMIKPYVMMIIDNLELPASSLRWERSQVPDF